MKTSFPNTETHRAFYNELRNYLKTPHESDQKTKSLGDLSIEYPKLIERLISLWLEDTNLLSAIEKDWSKEVPLVGGMVKKILSGEHLGKKDRRKVRIMLQRQVNHNTRDLFGNTPALLPIMDHAEDQAMKLLEQGIIPAFHDLNRPDYIVSGFDPFPGNIEHLNVSHKYGTLRGYVPPIGNFRRNSDFIYTDAWVLDGQWNPLFPLNKNLRESFNRSSSGYIGDGLFLVFQDKGNYQYRWEVKNTQGETLEAFDAGTVEHLGNGILFPSKDQYWNGTSWLYDTKNHVWILQGEYILHDSDSRKCVFQSQETKKYGIFDFTTRTWDIPCEQEKCGKIRTTGVDSIIPWAWFTKNEDGTGQIIDSEGKVVCPTPPEVSSKFQEASIFSESEKYRFFWAVKNTKSEKSKIWIISADGKNTIGPFGSCMQRDEVGATFIMDESKGRYAYLDFASGEVSDITITWERSYLREDFYSTCIVFKKNGKYGVKDFRGNILVAPQEFPIEGYYPKSQLLHVSREVRKNDDSDWKEEMEKEYQLIDMRGNVLLPWDTKLSNIRYVDVGVVSTDHGKLICTTESGTVIRDIPGGWVTVNKTTRRGVYIIDEDWDRGWHHYTLFNAYEDMVFVRGEWLPRDPEKFRYNHVSGASVLQNGYIVYGSSVVDLDGKMILPLGIWEISTSPFYDNKGNEIWVVCRYRNSLMKAIFQEKS